MVDVTYNYYTTEYFGDSVQEAEFPKYRKRAWTDLNYYSGGNASSVVADETNAEVVNAIRDCICELADNSKVLELNGGNQIESEKLGSRSVSYSQASLSRSSSKVIQGIIRKHLSRYGLVQMLVY